MGCILTLFVLSCLILRILETCSVLLTVFGSVFIGVLLLDENENFYVDSIGTKEQIKQDMLVTLVSIVVGGLIQMILNIVLLVGVKKILLNVIGAANGKEDSCKVRNNKI
ncbi:hypothetical protein C0J52_12634 [Blattella germanica]|nr:hypothetical protein C0J52_12634 [Blattella germanica]